MTENEKKVSDEILKKTGIRVAVCRDEAGFYFLRHGVACTLKENNQIIDILERSK